MSSAKGSQSSISFVKEVTWGITPASQFTGVNFTTDDMEYAIENQSSDTVRPDRQTVDVVQVGAECTGGFETELQALNIDNLLPAFFMVADWTLDVIQNGVVRTSFSIERAYNDVTQFMVYKGMVPNTMELSIESGSPIMCNLSFVGKEEVNAQATSSTPAASAVPTKPTFSAGTSVGSIEIDDVAVAACLIQKIDLTLDNQVEGKMAVGSLGFCDANANSLKVTGSISMYFTDETYYDLYLAGTEFKLEIPMTDSLGNEYNLELPACQFDSGSAPISGKDDDIMEEHTFIAIMGSGGYTIQLTRVVI